jgi:alpha-glucoside transport system permease protein
MSAVQTVAPPRAVRARRLAVRFRPTRFVLNVILGLIALFWLLPTLSLLVISLRPSSSFGVTGWWTVFTAPTQLTLQNYQSLFSTGFASGGILDSLITTALITVPVTILVTVLASLAAYSLVFGRWRGRTAVFLVIVALLVVPVQVALIPVAQLYKAFGQISGFNPFGTLPGVIIFHVAFGLPFGIFLMRNFYTGIPKDLLEAGRIDGAGEWTLPHHTLTIYLYGFTRTLANNYWVIATGGIISILIPLVIFFSFQRYFVRGVLAGAVK